jgi:hypothetical protein
MCIECKDDECCISLIVMMNVIRLSSAILNVIILSFVKLSVVAQYFLFQILGS